MERLYQVILLILVLYVLWRLLFSREFFDSSTTEFVPEGDARYGLRGNLLNTKSIQTLFYPADRNVRISNAGADMYQTLNVPESQSNQKCNKMACPTNADFNCLDTCYSCPSKPFVSGIPYIHSHR